MVALALFSPINAFVSFLLSQAYMGGWLSVYNNQWCNYPSVQVHEIGHNLNLAHAGEGSSEYADQTGMMGFSYSEDDTKMCYNPANSWQLGWYSLRRTSVDFSNGGSFRGKLIGVDNYEHTGSSDKYVNVKVSGSSSAVDVFVGFNLDAGINSGTKEGSNQVTVHTQEGSGKSDLVAKLSAKRVYTIENFHGDKTLSIQVNSIERSASPPFAAVDIFVGCLDDTYCVQGDDCAIGTCNVGTGACSYDRSSCPIPPTLNLEWVADDFSPSSYPLSECQGDCDNDEECEVRKTCVMMDIEIHWRRLN
jgi:hypothetical protein